MNSHCESLFSEIQFTVIPKAINIIPTNIFLPTTLSVIILPVDFTSFEQPLNIAHRGDAKHYPENTILAMDAAARLDIDVLETDLVLTKDNELVLSHDIRIDRTTNGTGLIQDYRLEELLEFDAGFQFQSEGQFPFRDQGITIPTATEFFPRYNEVIFNIDLKDKDPIAVDNFLQLVDEYDLYDRVIVGSFHDDQVTRLREACPSLTTNSTTKETAKFVFGSKLHVTRFLKTEPAFNVVQVPISRYHIGIINSRFIDMMHHRNIQVHAWIINDEPTMRSLLAMGIDGIFTDDPDRFAQVRRAYREELNHNPM